MKNKNRYSKVDGIFWLLVIIGLLVAAAILPDLLAN